MRCAATLPIYTLIGIGISLKIKSNTTQCDDEDSIAIMEFSSGVSLIKDLDMPYNSIVRVISITATGAIPSNSLITNTLTTSGVAINIKNDTVLFKGLDNSIYMDAHLRGVFSIARYLYTSLQNSKWFVNWITTCFQHFDSGHGGTRIGRQHFNEWNNNSSWTLKL